MEYLRANGYWNMAGLDFAPEALNFCQSRHLPRLFCADGTRPPLRQESFDLIMALDLIEHLADDVGALRELSRLLKPNAALVIFTPAFNFLWGLQDEVSYHYRRYTAKELRRKLEENELIVDRLSYVNMFLLPLIWAGRTILRLSGNNIQGTSENDLHPGWSNGLLQTVFAAERFLLRRWNLPIGVSLFSIARKPE
jgi:SAM-dependent methyltransferase